MATGFDKVKADIKQKPWQFAFALLCLVIGIVMWTLAIFSLEHPSASHHRSFLDVVRPWAELIYFLTGPALVAITFYGLQQLKLTREELKLTKEDMVVRNERAAKEKALEYSLRFATTFIPLAITFDETVEKIPELRTFTVWRRTSNYNDVIKGYQPSDVPSKVLDAARASIHHPDVGNSFHMALNELQAISAAFATGVADEQTGFDIMGAAFCGMVIDFLPCICVQREDRVQPLWKFIVDLDEIWRSRIRRIEAGLLQADADNLKNEANNRLDAIPIRQGNKLGLK